MGILEDVKELVREQVVCEYDDIKVGSKLVDDLGFGSIDVVELAMAIEERFDIEISDEEIEKVLLLLEMLLSILKKRWVR